MERASHVVVRILAAVVLIAVISLSAVRLAALIFAPTDQAETTCPYEPPEPEKVGREKLPMGGADTGRQLEISYRADRPDFSEVIPKYAPPRTAFTEAPLYNRGLTNRKPDLRVSTGTFAKNQSERVQEWYSDAPYYNLAEEFEEILASEPNDTNSLDEEFRLASYLCGEHFDGWTDIFGRNPRGKDQFEKAMRLYDHIVKHYPQNEYKTIVAKIQLSGLTLNLKRDPKRAALGYIDVFTVPVDSVVDSTSPRRNTHSVQRTGESDSKTQAQRYFERFVKDHLRTRAIEVCLMAEEIEAYMLLGEIVAKCEATDPEIALLAQLAKFELDHRISGENNFPFLE